MAEGWNAPSLADAGTGIGTSSVKEIAPCPKTGHNASADATDPMADAMSHSTSHLTDDDLTDIAFYLKSAQGSGAPRPAPVPASLPAMQEGAQIYAHRQSRRSDGAGRPQGDASAPPWRRTSTSSSRPTWRGTVPLVSIARHCDRVASQERLTGRRLPGPRNPNVAQGGFSQTEWSSTCWCWATYMHFDRPLEAPRQLPKLRAVDDQKSFAFRSDRRKSTELGIILWTCHVFNCTRRRPPMPALVSMPMARATNLGSR